MRTNADVQVIEQFAGVNNLVDELNLPEGFVPWSHGGFYNEQMQYERLKGKLSISSSTSLGPVLSLAQVDFKRAAPVVVHHGSRWDIEDDLVQLRSTPPSASPMEAFIP
jgi:hypothetical protein